jgi:acyl-CoA thioester hydrolase
MPQTYERTFRVRHYECDPYGHLNNANYLRYMQETAFDASAAVGYGMDRHRAMGRVWLIRSTDIEYLRQASYNQQVKVRTWVADFWRAHSHRAYEFRDAGTGELIAQAVTDWAFLDSEAGRPAVIPQELAEAFIPEGSAHTRRLRARIPPAPSPPPGVFSLRRQVEWRDLDPNGHVNNAVYLSFADDCGVQVAGAFGWPLARCHEAGFAIIVRRHQIAYRKPAVLDDELEVSTWVSDPRRSSAFRHYRITRMADGECLARVRTRYVWIDLGTRHPIRIPPGFMDDFAPNIA